MAEIVLDASALLAMLQNERGGDQVTDLVLNPENKAIVSTLNWGEVFDRLLRNGIAEETVAETLRHLELETVDFNVEQARRAASYRLSAPSLSQADRACLALAAIKRKAVWTTDKAWSKLDLAALGVSVTLLR